MTLTEVQAFQAARDKINNGSSAVGKYQFMPSTLFGRTDKKGNHIPGLVDQLGLSMDTKFTGPIQEQLQELLISYHNAYEQGQINKDELVSLMQGINIMEGLGDDVDSLYRKEQLNTILNAAISAASMLA